MVNYKDYVNAENVLYSNDREPEEVEKACSTIIDWLEQENACERQIAWDNRFAVLPLIMDAIIPNYRTIKILLDSLADRKVKIHETNHHYNISKKISSFLIHDDESIIFSAASCLTLCCGELGKKILSKISGAISKVFEDGDE